MEVPIIVKRPAIKSVGRNATKKANGQLAPAAVYIKEIIRIGTPPVTSPKVAMKDDHPLTSRTRPVAFLTNTVGLVKLFAKIYIENL
jgi:hypothetical protein